MNSDIDNIHMIPDAALRERILQGEVAALRAALAARDEALRPFAELAEAIKRRKSSTRPYSDESLIVSTCGRAIVWKHVAHAAALVERHSKKGTP